MRYTLKTQKQCIKLKIDNTRCPLFEDLQVNLAEQSHFQHSRDLHSLGVIQVIRPDGNPAEFLPKKDTIKLSCLCT